MSKRPITDKKLAGLARAIRRNQNTVPVKIDLINYLVSRRLAKSKRHAKQLLVDGSVKVDGETIGRFNWGGTWYPAPEIPAVERSRISVES